MLLSKAAIRDELSRRMAEFAPPGEQLQGLFVDERGQIPFDDSTGAPIYVLLTTNYEIFVGIKSFTNTPTRALGAVPRQSSASVRRTTASPTLVSQMQDRGGGSTGSGSGSTRSGGPKRRR